MDTIGIVQYILLFGYLHGFVIIFNSIITGRIKVKPYLYLNLLVCFLSLNNLQAWLNQVNISFHSYYLDNLYTPWYIFLAPFFFLFITAYIDSKYKKHIVGVSIIFFVVSSLIKITVLYANSELTHQLLLSKLWLVDKISEGVDVLFTIVIVSYAYRIINKKRKSRSFKDF